MVKIEDAVNSTEAVLDGLTGVEGSLTGLQAQSDVLDAVAGLTGTGLVEKTGDAAFTVRDTGVGTASAIPTRADNDDRYIRKTGTEAVSTATITRTVPVLIDGTVRYLMLSDTP